MRRLLTRRSGLRAALALFATISVSAIASARDKGTIYYLVPTLLDEFQTESANLFETVIGSLGYEVHVLQAQNRAITQLNQLDNVIQLHPKAIIMAAVDPDSVIPGIEKARAANISVIQFDRQVTGTMSDFTSVAGTVEIGQIAAKEVLSLLEFRYGSYSGKVLQIMGDPGDPYTLDIQKGFDQRLSTQPGIKVISKAALQWEPSNAGDIIENQLLINADIDLIFVHAAHLAVPAVAILQSKGKQPGDVMLVSSNGAPIGLQLIRTGWEQVEVEQPLYAQVYGIAIFIERILNREVLKAGTYDVIGTEAVLTYEKWGWTLKTPGTAINKENVDDPHFWGNRVTPYISIPQSD